MPAKKYIKCFTSTVLVESWKLIGTSEESIEEINKSDRQFAQTFLNHN